MNTLYESILNSTKSGKNHLPLHFSKEYTFEQADDAIEDYYDFYKIKNHYFDINKKSDFEDVSYEKLIYILMNFEGGNKKTKFSFVKDLEFYKKFSRCSELANRIFSEHVDFQYVWLIRVNNNYYVWEGYSTNILNINGAIKKYDLA